MVSPTKRKNYVGPITCLIFFITLATGCCLADQQMAQSKEMVLAEQKLQDPNEIQEPVIIWFHTVDKDPNILRTALSGGVFTCVMLEGMHIDDIPSYRHDPKVRLALAICRSANVKVIWSRWMWPGYNIERFSRSDPFDSDYYLRQIVSIKAEARQMNVEYTAFDLEPYSKTEPMKLRKRNLTNDEFQMIIKAVDTATEKAGKVDYIVPAALPYPRYTRFKREFYKSLQGLGKLSIAGHTYYNNESALHCENNVFDVFGAYCKKDPIRPQYPDAPCFAPREILERQDLWGQKKGLFIYAGEKQDLWETAIEFSKIKSISAKSKESSGAQNVRKPD